MEVVRDTKAMLAGLTPVLQPGVFVFCTTSDAALAQRAASAALAWFKEAEGFSLILDLEAAKRFGFSTTAAMRRIVLEVYSALEGVGLTAAVSQALAAEGIACNMVSAFYHDHVFVPVADAERSLHILRTLQAGAAD